MMKWYANTFEITERHLTKKYIRKTSILSWIIFLSLSFDIFFRDWNPDTAPSVLSVFVFAMLFVFLFCLGALLFNPLVMRFWARDKFLDEWELDIKRRGMKSGFTVLLAALLFGSIYFLTTADYINTPEANPIGRLVIGDALFSLILFATFFQVQTQLRRIQPVDQEEWDEESVERKTVWRKVLILLFGLFLLIGPPACKGMIAGFTDGLNGQPVKSEAQ